ncbi:MAG: toxin-antitoxin system YwqK family antitoxin [Flammeovirgaceae bacterium]
MKYLRIPSIYLVFTLSLFLNLQLIAQEDDKTNGTSADTALVTLEEFEQPTLELSPNAVDKKKRKEAKKNQQKAKTKKAKKNVFYGIKAKKFIIKKVRGKNVYTEKFYVLPNYQPPSKYAQEKYYFDPRAKPTKRKIVRVAYVHQKYGLPLHGTYEKKVNGETIEKGIYYKGTKHGRWEKYKINKRDNRGYELIEKKKYDKGFPKDAHITYYDHKKTKVKEVIPFVDEKREGTYLKFYKSGRLMEKGKYQNEKKVGKWTEYYDRDRANRKVVTEYPKYYWEEGEGKVINRW